jgi:hypothetical protein
LQQPFGHEVASQTHCPVLVLHSWPDEQAPHVAPPAPHVEFDSLDSTTQVVLLLQHPEHAVPLHVHTPLTHASPVLHAVQAAPAVPHDAADCEAYGSHVLPLQQPFGHETASQTHFPVLLLHSCPEAHALQLAPPVPHEVFDSEE